MQTKAVAALGGNRRRILTIRKDLDHFARKGNAKRFQALKNG